MVGLQVSLIGLMFLVCSALYLKTIIDKTNDLKLSVFYFSLAVAYILLTYRIGGQ